MPGQSRRMVLARESKAFSNRPSGIGTRRSSRTVFRRSWPCSVTELHESFLDLVRTDDPAVRRRIDARRAACDEALGLFRGDERSQLGAEDEYDIHWLSLDAPRVMKPRERTSARVSFSHAGRLPLSNRALCLSYHWLDADNPSRAVVWEAPRTPVRRVLDPGRDLERRDRPAGSRRARSIPASGRPRAGGGRVVQRKRSRNADAGRYDSLEIMSACEHLAWQFRGPIRSVSGRGGDE